MDCPRQLRSERTKSPLYISSHPSGPFVALLSVLLVASFMLAACQAEEQAEKRDQEEHLREQPNRQYFKVHLISGSKATGNSKLLTKSKAPRHQLAVDSAAGAELIKAANGNNKGQQQESSKQLPKQKGTISSATLKKLLNQTLLKSARNNATNLATEAGQKAAKSNFKFVFIQRATAAPHQSSSKAATSSSPTSTSPPTRLNDNTEQQSSGKSSLAVSVSKQLATSLLNSAAGLVANLSQSSPSLSSLASQIVAASAEAANSIGDSMFPPALELKRNNNSTAAVSEAAVSAVSDLSAESSKTNGSRQEQQQQQVSSSSNETGAPKKGSSSNKKVTKSKPAKIYNLPVKFVANGQPNHVAVFHTLKEHFATIKRLQALGSNGGTKTAGVVRHNKERKHQQHQQKLSKLKGVNSRLIYLPLRYLSNARPNKIMITGSKSSARATHKSSANS